MSRQHGSSACLHFSLPSQVEELWSLDKESVDALKPVHGLIFLFKWISETDSRTVDPEAPQVFFAKQVGGLHSHAFNEDASC